MCHPLEEGDPDYNHHILKWIFRLDSRLRGNDRVVTKWIKIYLLVSWNWNNWS